MSWILAEAGGPEIQRQVAEFEKQNPNIEVELITAPLLGFPTRFGTQARAGEMPDLVTVDLAWIQGWAREEFLRDLNPFIDKAGGKKYLGEYYDTLIQLASQKGGVYGLPRFAGGYLLYYNKDMFSAAGLDPAKPPTNWEELLQYARKLTKKDAAGNTVQYGYGLHGMNRTDVVSRFVNWMYANGADVISADGKTALLDQPKAIETLKFWSELYTKEKVVPPGVIQAHPGTVRSQFAQKQIAMELGILWGVDMVFAENPALKASLEVAPFPRQNSSYPSNFQAVYDSISATSKHPEEAFKLLEFMLRPENQLSLFKRSRYGPTQPRVFNMADVKHDAYAQAMAKVNQHLKPLPSIPQWEQVSKIMGDAMQLTLNGAKTPEAAFKEANAQINQLLR
ncbi:MAG: ABC transporter substrate-binding protein [Candidatus Methylomirabilales bacterium]